VIRSHRASVGAAVGARFVAAVPAAATAQVVPVDQVLVQRLDGQPGHRIANAVAAAGDVDGDGLGDLVIGAAFARPQCQAARPDAYVAFSRPGVPTGSVGAGPGFSMRLAPCQQGTGLSVAGAGDVNGDGHADVIVGAPGFRRGTARGAGGAFVVFGSSSTRPVDLGHLGSRGFRIDGGPGDAAGRFVAGVGDLNGDGRSDVAVGTDRGIERASGGGIAFVGVVFGSPSRRALDLHRLGPRGFRIRGYAQDDGFGTAIAGIGDLNRDGRDDLVVGAPRAPRGRSIAAGGAFVVYGSRSRATVRTTGLGARGYTILGNTPDARLGASVGGAGDVNGDGVPDIVLGSPQAPTPGRSASGRAWIVFGTRARRSVDVGRLATNGIAVVGAPGDLLGSSLGGAGDVDGDGLGDVVIAAPGVPTAPATGRPGRIYVVAGSRTPPAELDLVTPAPPALRIDGSEGSGLGLGVDGMLDDAHGQQSVGTLGDTDGDGRSELFAAAAPATYGGPASGSVYVLRGVG
jgi:hypothetical protein